VPRRIVWGHRVEVMWPSVPVFLFLAPLSRSLHYRPYLDTFQNGTFLEWWVDRFHSRHPGQPLTILMSQFEGGTEQARLRCPASVFVSSSVSKLGMLFDAAARLRAGTLAACGLGFAFAPPDLLPVALEHHFHNKNDCTLIRGLPFGVAPEIYKLSLIERLSKLTLPGLPKDPAAVVGRLAEAAKHFPIEGPLIFRHTPLDAERMYGAEAGALPESVHINRHRDLDIAREVIRTRGISEDPLSELRAWRKISIRVRQKVREQSHFMTFYRFPTDRSRKPRVLLISNQSAFSGAEESLCQLARHIDKQRFELFAAVGAKGLFVRRLKEAGVKVLSGDAGFGGTPTEQYLHLADVLQRVNPSFVHFNSLAHPHFPGLLVGLGIPFITHCRVSEVSPFGDQLRMATKIIAVSEYAKRRVLCMEVDPNSVEVVYDEVDTAEFSPDLFHKPFLRQRLGFPEKAFVLLLIARFAPNKRHALAIRAAEEVKRFVPDMILVLKGESFGDSSTAEEIMRLVRTRGLSDWIRIIPFVNDIRELYVAADALILCSEREALGRCVVEAMAMGTPVIVSDSGGTHEIIDHGNTGYVVHGENLQKWAEQIVEVARDERLRESIGRNARAFARKKLDSRISARRVMAIYDAILSSKTSPRRRWRGPSDCRRSPLLP